MAQSLRNPESVIGSIFPADLYVGGKGTGIPIARSDRGVLAAEYRPREGVRVTGQLYARSFDGLSLVAPRTGGPFADGDVTAARGVARGLSLDGAVSAARYGLMASFGWQRVRLHYDGGSYVPEYGSTRTIQAGGIVFLAPTMSVRFGVIGVAGRRATPTESPFEWESCNALDDGCELSGTPIHATDRLGGIRLPPYLRIDAGFRKHWHVGVAGRDAQLGIFGTVTNVLGRRNVFTMADDGSPTRMTTIAMRPRVPLVVGLDWRF
jgi:hypothetical protein